MSSLEKPANPVQPECVPQQDPKQLLNGRIATVPRQSVQSCEKVIEVLTWYLDEMVDALEDAIRCYICVEPDDPSEYRYHLYFESIRETQQLLRDLKQDWPHLDLPQVYPSDVECDDDTEG